MICYDKETENVIPLAISVVRTDGNTQSRISITQEIVDQYASEMTTMYTFPPIIVFYDGQYYWLADGFHRFEAAKKINSPYVLALVHQGTQREAMLYSAGANATHGLRRSNADKRRAVEKLLLDSEWSQWSDSAIANACQVDHKTVARIRAALSSTNGLKSSNSGIRTCAGGRTIDTTNIGKKSNNEICTSKSDLGIPKSNISESVDSQTIDTVNPTSKRDESICTQSLNSSFNTEAKFADSFTICSASDELSQKSEYQTRDTIECLNSILEYLEVEEFEATDVKNSQVRYKQTEARFPLLICDTKILETDDCDTLTVLYKDKVAIITSNSLIEDTATDKYFTYLSKVEKILRLNVAKLSSQIDLKQESVHNQQYLEAFLDQTVKPAVIKLIFPSIPKLSDIFDFIEAHYHEPIRLRDVARSFGYSAAYLTSVVRRQTGQSLYRWINKRRISAACSLLLETDQSIESIASEVGYRSTWCFFRNFRKIFNTTPGNWLSEARSNVTKT